MILSLLALAVSVLTGLLLVESCWPRNRRGLRDALFKLCLGSGLGMGFSGALAFLVTLLVGFRRDALIAADIVALAALIATVAWQRRRTPTSTDAALNPEPATETRLAWVTSLAAFFALLMIAAVAIFVMIAEQMPEGAWDAWAFWNLRAKHLVELPGSNWRQIFMGIPGLIGWRLDYPPLLPFIIARAWAWGAAEPSLVPVIVAALFVFSIAGVLVSALSRVASRATALMAGIALVGTPVFLRMGAWCYADVPLSWFFLATVALLTLAEAHGETPHKLPLLAGLSLGFASLTKNEGILFLAVASATWTVMVYAREWWKERKAEGLGPRRSLRRWLAFVIGVAAPVALLVYFKFVVVQGVEAVSPDGIGPLPPTSPEKHAAIALELGKTVFGAWYWPTFPWALAALVPLLGMRMDRNARSASFAGLVVVALMLAGYYTAYTFTKFEIHWLLSTTTYRLWMHLLPMTVFVAFLFVRPPDRP